MIERDLTVGYIARILQHRGVGLLDCKNINHP
jgi:hypothetical protein